MLKLTPQNTYPLAEFMHRVGAIGLGLMTFDQTGLPEVARQPIGGACPGFRKCSAM